MYFDVVSLKNARGTVQQGAQPKQRSIFFSLLGVLMFIETCQSDPIGACTCFMHSFDILCSYKEISEFLKALRYVRSVRLGAYMCQNGLHWVKEGLKWAIFKAFGTLQGPKIAQHVDNNGKTYMTYNIHISLWALDGHCYFLLGFRCLLLLRGGLWIIPGGL